MEATKRLQVTGAMALFALCGSVVGLPRVRGPARTAGITVTLPVPPPPRTPFERELRQAWQCRTRARLYEVRQREALEAWDPAAVPPGSGEAVRRAQLAADPTGALREAQTKVRQAAALSRTPQDVFRSTELLARIECDRGYHEVELREARRLVELEPGDERSWITVWHAAKCNGLAPLASEAEEALEGLKQASER